MLLQSLVLAVAATTVSATSVYAGSIENSRLLGSYYEGPNGIFLVPNDQADPTSPTPTFVPLLEKRQGFGPAPSPYVPPSYQSTPKGAPSQSQWPPYQSTPTRSRSTSSTPRYPSFSRATPQSCAYTVVLPASTVTSLVYGSSSPLPIAEAAPSSEPITIPQPPPTTIEAPPIGPMPKYSNTTSSAGVKTVWETLVVTSTVLSY